MHPDVIVNVILLLLSVVKCDDDCFTLHLFRFGPRESKKAMMYSDVGRLNCSVSFTTFSTQTRGQVQYHADPCIVKLTLMVILYALCQY